MSPRIPKYGKNCPTKLPLKIPSENRCERMAQKKKEKKEKSHGNGYEWWRKKEQNIIKNESVYEYVCSGWYICLSIITYFRWYVIFISNQAFASSKTCYAVCVWIWRLQVGTTNNHLRRTAPMCGQLWEDYKAALVAVRHSRKICIFFNCERSKQVARMFIGHVVGLAAVQHHIMSYRCHWFDLEIFICCTVWAPANRKFCEIILDVHSVTEDWVSKDR